MALRAHYADPVLLPRPDHYVAACIPVTEIVQRSALVEALLQQTGRTSVTTNKQVVREQ